MKDFRIASLSDLRFGQGSLRSLPDILGRRGIGRIALITGSRSLGESSSWKTLVDLLGRAGVSFDRFAVSGEPEVGTVDDIVAAFGTSPPDAVVAVGGGSVIDTGKAVAAMATMEGSVAEYLDDVGTRKPTGSRLFFVAVPTTAGTGSEATRNAVISRRGDAGFKKSLRHEAYVPDVAIIDPELALSGPPGVTAASGMDAVTQLLEAFVSTAANPFTDALALEGLRSAGRCFMRAVQVGGQDIEARAGMAWAAWLSGVCLANAGLGVVHGVAQPAGTRTDIPHGVLCGTLIGEATRLTIGLLMRHAYGDPVSEPARAALEKYAEAGKALSGRDADSLNGNCALLVRTLDTFIRESGISRLSAYGFDDALVEQCASETGLKNHPWPLSAGEIVSIMRARL